MQLLTDDKSWSQSLFRPAIHKCKCREVQAFTIRDGHIDPSLNRSIFTSQDEMQDEVMKC